MGTAPRCLWEKVIGVEVGQHEEDFSLSISFLFDTTFKVISFSILEMNNQKPRSSRNMEVVLFYLLLSSSVGCSTN